MKMRIQIINAVLTVLFLVLIGNTSAESALIKHDINAGYKFAKYFKIGYFIESFWIKDIRYFIVQDTDGEIKVALDACELCWSEGKGYRQDDSVMKCNSCGNAFLIRELGKQGEGGCWPINLEYEIVDNWIIIDEDDLLAKESFFPLPFISVNEEETEFSFNYNESSRLLRFVNQLDTPTEIAIYSVAGSLANSYKIDTKESVIDLSNFMHGAYYAIATSNNKKNIFKLIINY